jgi:hypothetical protein
MLRRDFVRAVVTVSLSPKLLLSQQAGNPAPALPAPVPWTLGLNPRTPIPHTEVLDAVAETEVRFFTSQQMATLVRLSDVLLPPIGNKPGALQAQTPQFLDFLIGSSPDKRKKTYTQGLDWLDAEAQRKSKMPFAKLNDAQAEAILKPWLRTWMNDHPPTEPHADFINIAHDDIRTATVNSEVWNNAPSVGSHESNAAGLYWYPIEPDIYEKSSVCAHVPAHVRAVPKASHPIPVYSR